MALDKVVKWRIALAVFVVAFVAVGAYFLLRFLNFGYNAISSTFSGRGYSVQSPVYSSAEPISPGPVNSSMNVIPVGTQTSSQNANGYVNNSTNNNGPNTPTGTTNVNSPYGPGCHAYAPDPNACVTDPRTPKAPNIFGSGPSSYPGYTPTYYPPTIYYPPAYYPTYTPPQTNSGNTSVNSPYGPGCHNYAPDPNACVQVPVGNNFGLYNLFYSPPY